MTFDLNFIYSINLSVILENRHIELLLCFQIHGVCIHIVHFEHLNIVLILHGVFLL